MLVIGAGGHALEVLDVLNEKNSDLRLSFFDNISNDAKNNFYSYPIIKNYTEVKKLFQHNRDFVLALGGTNKRFHLSEKIISLGGNLLQIISTRANVSQKSSIGKGVNIMPFSGIFGNAIIEDGVLVNAYCSIHHDVIIGKFSELSPGCRILGGSKIGKYCTIGTNAVILPNIQIGDQIIIGAGSVVTKNIDEIGIYVGSPARKIN